MTIKSINSQIKALEKKKAALEQAEKAGIAQLKAVVSKYKLTRQDVLSAVGGALKGRKVAPKYRNPDNKNETWTGRGRQPRWVAAKLKAGKKLEDMKI
jgi:DNA-binding protein H-NS